MRRVIRNTDGFVGGLIREALVGVEGEVEHFKLHDKIAHLAKHKYRKRNAPQYQLVVDTIALMVRDGEISERYAPSQYDDDRRRLGHTYYRRTEA